MMDEDNKVEELASFFEEFPFQEEQLLPEQPHLTIL
jgi:hypothetical protein